MPSSTLLGLVTVFVRRRLKHRLEKVNRRSRWLVHDVRRDRALGLRCLRDSCWKHHACGQANQLCDRLTLKPALPVAGLCGHGQACIRLWHVPPLAQQSIRHPSLHGTNDGCNDCLGTETDKEEQHRHPLSVNNQRMRSWTSSTDSAASRSIPSSFGASASLGLANLQRRDTDSTTTRLGRTHAGKGLCLCCSHRMWGHTLTHTRPLSATLE
jgi:hypothetical protein